MSYTDFLKELDKSSDGTSLFLANKTKNIYAIDNLVDKGFLPAVLKRIEMAAADNQPEKVTELKRRALEIAPIEYIDEVKSKMDEIVKECAPVLLQRKRMTIS